MAFLDQIAELEPQYLWLIFAVILAIGEIIIPGVFLIWIAAAAAITGLLTFAIGFSPALQFGIFALLCISAVYLGRKWYLEKGAVIADPKLNDRSARMIGQTVVVTQEVSEHGGRVKIADGEWPAKGKSMSIGEQAKVVDVIEGVLLVEAI